MSQHSPLGASGAERWMNCPGSAVLLKKLDLPQTDEADYQIEGSTAHDAAATAIVNRQDAWELVGDKFYNGTAFTIEMADAVQVYLDHVAPLRDREGKMWWCEFHIASDVHELFYGTVDFAALADDLLDVVDFKYGQGIVVEPYKNPQLMYYAYGMLQYHPAKRVRLTIVQPRAYHESGPIREWECSAEEIIAWGEQQLVPAMQAAEIDETLDAGPWCRFCPAKLACPLLVGLFQAAAMINPKIIPNLSDEALGRDYKLREAVKFYLKAQDDEMFRRLNAGREIATAKLVNKRADRVWKVGALPALEELGPDRFTTPEIKSPAQIEKLGPRAKGLVQEWAYMPQTGLTVAPIDDRRLAVKVQTTEQAFGEAVAKLGETI